MVGRVAGVIKLVHMLVFGCSFFWSLGLVGWFCTLKAFVLSQVCAGAKNEYARERD